MRYDITAGLRLPSRSNPAGALAVGIGKTAGGLAKKIGFAGKLEQPLLRNPMWLDGAIGADVAGRYAPLGESAADQ
jgi:hypothetical protein